MNNYLYFRKSGATTKILGTHELAQAQFYSTGGSGVIGFYPKTAVGLYTRQYYTPTITSSASSGIFCYIKGTKRVIGLSSSITVTITYTYANAGMGGTVFNLTSVKFSSQIYGTTTVTGTSNGSSKSWTIAQGTTSKSIGYAWQATGSTSTVTIKLANGKSHTATFTYTGETVTGTKTVTFTADELLYNSVNPDGK